MTLRWGLLSTAKINDALLAGIAASPTAEVRAVASRDLDRARAYASERGIPTAHGDYDSLLADPDVDAVYISLPNGLHVEWTERALAAGKHVLCEKPMDRDPAAVERAFDLAERSGRVLMEAFMYRHHPQTLRLAELVAEGAIGRLRVIRASFGFRLTDPTNVRLDPALDGGALMDLGCYCVSAARLLAGEPETVVATSILSDSGVDLGFTGALRFPGDVLAHFDASFQTVDGGPLVVAGDAGTLHVADPWHIRAPGIELTDADGTRHIEIPAADSYRLEIEDLAAAVAGERPARLGRADAVGQARTIAALYTAADAARGPA